MFVFLLICLCSLHVSMARKNVLFIIADDLRPELGSYVDTDEALFPGIKTPNIDALAEDSILFSQAYCSVPVCAPSRTSILTGRRPDTTKVYDLNTYWRDVGGNFTTMPQYFKENGYVSIGMSKVFHGGSSSGGNDDSNFSWSEDYFHPDDDYWSGRNFTWRIALDNETSVFPLPDEQTKNYAIQKLKDVAEGAISEDIPFFMAVGFEKPHLSFIAPESFYELYSPEDIYLPNNPYTAQDYPFAAWYKMHELKRYYDIQELGYNGTYNETLPDFQILNMRRGYYASVSYVDSLVGELLQTLNELELSNNTIVVFSSDHGYNLGEHAMWNKHTNINLALHVPLMIKIPGLTDGGIISNAFVENIDLFPTLVEATGNEVLPQCSIDSSDVLLCHEGYSMMELIERGGIAEWKSAVFSQFYNFEEEDFVVMGYSVMDNRYRYSKWVDFSNETVDWDIVLGVELYDHVTDPNEVINVAYDPSYESEREIMDEKLMSGWRSALPV